MPSIWHRRGQPAVEGLAGAGANQTDPLQRLHSNLTGFPTSIMERTFRGGIGHNSAALEAPINALLGGRFAIMFAEGTFCPFDLLRGGQMRRVGTTVSTIVSLIISSAAFGQSSPCPALPVGIPSYTQMPYQAAPAGSVPPSPMVETTTSRPTAPPPPPVADLPASDEPGKGPAILELKPSPCSTGQGSR